MERTNFSLKSLNWSVLLKETAEDSCDSDETFCDAMNIGSNENNLQYCDQNFNKNGGKIDNQPMDQEICDTTTSNQNTVPWPKEERNPHLSDHNIKYNLVKGFKVNDEPYVESNYNDSLNFPNTITMAVNNCIEQGDKNKHRFESDFGFTDDMSCSTSMQSLSNKATLQTTDFGRNKSTILIGCTSNNKPVEFGLDADEDKCKTLDSDLEMLLEPHETCKEAQLVTGENCLTCEDQSTRELLSDVGEEEFLDGLTPNLDHSLINYNFFENFTGCQEIPKIKPCSPPLTLNKVTHRKILPADKILPNYRKKNMYAEKKLLPSRKCSSAYIDLSNRKCDKVTGNPMDTEELDILSPKTDSEAQNVKVQSQTRRENCRKPLFELEVTRTKSNRTVKQNFPVKKKRGRKKKSLYDKEKRETTSESASQEIELNKGVDKTLQEMKVDVEYIEEKVARWISGVNEDPPTRELAFEMLADVQSHIATLQHLKKKHESKRKCVVKCELKLIKHLLERSKQLETTVDKAIAEADRLMKMELNEISEDCQMSGSEIFTKGTTKEYKYIKPILKSSSSEPSTEERFSNKRKISFSEEVDCRYLSSSGQSSSLGPSQSFYEQQSRHSISSINTGTNNIRTHDETVSNKISGKSLFSNLSPTTYVHHKSNPFENNGNPEFDLLSFKNLAIGTSISMNYNKSEERKRFESKKNGVVENMCEEEPLLVESSKTKNSFLMNNTNKDKNLTTSKTESVLHPTNIVDDLNYCVKNYRCNTIGNSGEKKMFTKNYLTQFIFSDNFNCNPVFDNNKNTHNQTTDLIKKRKLALPDNIGINDQKHEMSIKTAEERNINFDGNNSLACDQKQMDLPNTAVNGSVLPSETSVQCPQACQMKVNVHPTSETLDSNKNTVIRLCENSTGSSENFGFSEQNTQPEEFWEKFSIMNIKSVRIPDPLEFMPWNPADPQDDWADLEDWSMCTNKVDQKYC